MEVSKYLPVKLNNKNYQTWQFKTRMVLIREGLWKYVEPGTPPTTLTDAWTEGDQKALATIALAVESQQDPIIIKCETAKAAWLALKNYHHKATLTSKVTLLKAICNKNFRDGENMEQHLFEMEELFSKLDNADEKLSESLKVAMILRSLPDSFNALTTALESRNDDDLTLELIRPKLIDEALKLKNSNSKETVMKARNFKNSKNCFYCDKPGHLKKNCHKFLADSKTEVTNNAKKKNHSARKVNEERKEYSIMANENTTINKGWILDSGATSHMCNDKSLFKIISTSSVKSVTVADGYELPVLGEGVVKIQTCDEIGNCIDLNLKKTLFVPTLDSNLISMSKLVANNVNLAISKSECKLTMHGETLAIAEIQGDLFVIRMYEEKSCVAKSRHQIDCQHIWHRRFGHRDPTVIADILRKELAIGLKVSDCGVHEPCIECIKGKMSRIPFPKKSNSKTSQVLDLIHADVGCVPNTPSPSGTKYFLTLIDDYSRFIEIYFMKCKSEVASCIKEYATKVENQFGRKIKRIRSDQGGEFSSNELTRFYKAEGIQVQYTAGYSPQQNGVAERRNRHLIEMARCMLLDAGMEKCYWPEALNTAAYLQNVLPSSAVDKTPHELWYGKKPDLSILRVFGCKAEVHIPKEKRTKLSDKSKSLIFVGYSLKHKAYRFMNPETNEITISRDAVFMERKSDSPMKANTKCPIKKNLGESNEESGCFLPPLASEFQETSDNESVNETLHSIDFESALEDTLFEEESTLIEDSQEEFENNEEIDEIDYGRPRRLRNIERINYRTPRNHKVQEKVGISIEKEKDPTTFKQAINSLNADKWKEAMDAEIKSLLDNETWQLVELPAGQVAIGAKWIFKQKEDEHGNVVRFKARLVALGCSQKFGRDYDEVFAPVVKQVTIRMMLTIAIERHLIVQHVDVKNAYLHGELTEVVYMKQPPGYENGENLVCRLVKSLYGLKQGARDWNRKIDQTLKSMSFNQSNADPCLYIRVKNGHPEYMLIYVDDMIVAVRTLADFTEIVAALKKNFKITELGELRYFLGIHVKKIDGKYALSQKSYIRKALEKFNLADCKESKIPMDSGYVSQKEESGNFEKIDIYRSLIGTLLYISTNTRPDIAIATSILGRRVVKPSKSDWSEAKRVLRYLKGTIDHCLFLQPKGLELEIFVDADWASDSIDRKSNSGFIFKFGNSLIDWKSHKQQSVSLSSTEAEYIALAECCQQMLWIVKLMKSFEIPVNYPITVKEDNQSCIKIAEKEKFERNTKHIDTKFNFVKELVKSNKIVLQYCPTSEMVADILTKPLQAIKIQYFTSLMGIAEMKLH